MTLAMTGAATRNQVLASWRWRGCRDGCAAFRRLRATIAIVRSRDEGAPVMLRSAAQINAPLDFKIAYLS